jgi:hypothetical protein
MLSHFVDTDQEFNLVMDVFRKFRDKKILFFREDGRIRFDKQNGGCRPGVVQLVRMGRIVPAYTYHFHPFAFL